ncbi:MAG TPA: helix-turn-helix domain-containing protein, partial [Anaeromyxobacteraceae bacterium]
EHAVERAVVLCRAEVLDVADLPDAVRRAAGSAPPGAPGAIAIPVGTPMDEVERIVIRETLRQTRGDKTLAAQILGIAARTIYRKLERDESGRLVDPEGEA